MKDMEQKLTESQKDLLDLIDDHRLKQNQGDLDTLIDLGAIISYLAELKIYHP